MRRQIRAAAAVLQPKQCGAGGINILRRIYIRHRIVAGYEFPETPSFRGTSSFDDFAESVCEGIIASATRGSRRLYYPAEMPVPENGGGLAFFSENGRVKLYTYGQYDIDVTPSIREAQRDEELNWIGSTGRVTYRTGGTNWFVSSGIDHDGRIFYERYEQRRLGDTSCRIVFTISYPQSLRSAWYASTERTARSFRAPSSCIG